MARPLASASSASGASNAFLNSDTAISGLRSNFEGTITDARYEQWDFKGKAKAKPSGKSGVVMALKLTIDDIDDGNPKPEENYLPCGAIEDFVPSDDGQSFEAVTGRTGFFRDMEVLQFADAVVETGAIAKSDLSIDPSVFVGLRFYWERKPPRWAKPDDTKHSTLVPTKYVETAKKSKAATAAKGKPAPPADDNEPDAEIIDWGKKLVLEALEDLPEIVDPKTKKKSQQETISREDLGSEVLALMLAKYKKEITKDVRNAIGALFENDDFLQSNSGRKTWHYDASDGEVTRV
jgi:hypothetical protein